MQCSVAQGQMLLGEMIQREPTRLSARIGRMIRDQVTAEDLAQDALLRALHGLHTLRGEPAEPVMCAWLDRIARNVAFNYVRNQGRRPIHEGDAQLENLATEGLDPGSAVASDDATAHLISLVQALPPDLKQVFLLREMEGLSTAATAQLLGIKDGLVKWRLHKARQRLQTSLHSLS